MLATKPSYHQPMLVTVLLYVVGVVLLLVGLAGLVLPGLPGAPLMFAGLLSVAWADGFERIGWPGLVTTGLIAAVISAVDWISQVAGAKQFGASYWGMAGAVIGLGVGLFFGLPGIVLGPVVGAVVVELIREPDLRRAGKVGLGTLIGFVLGTAVKYALALVFVGVAVFLYLA